MKLTLPELLKITGTTDQGLKTLRRRGQLALAFGRRHAFSSLGYIPLDAVAWLIAGTLAKPYSATEAAQLVRIWSDVWATVVAEAEAKPDIDALFCIVDFERETDGKHAHMACGSHGTTPEQIAAIVQRTPEAAGFRAVSINCCNVSHLIRFIRKTAAKYGIDLTGAFLPPPDSDEFIKLFAPYAEVRDAAIVTVRDRKKRDALSEKIGEQVRKEFAALDEGAIQ